MLHLEEEFSIKIRVGKMSREMNRRIGATSVVMCLLYQFVVVKKGEALELPADLSSYPLTKF